MNTFAMANTVFFRTAILFLFSGVVQSRPNIGKPLHLTPYIRSGQITQAIEASKVQSLLPNLKSYSGYLTVDPKFNSHLFFWFFPAEVNSENAPVVLWLQGGPGYSSLFATFEENGPFKLTKDNRLKRRNYYWSQKMNVVYIDNPVGAGFSYTENEGGRVKNEEQVGRYLYEGLLQFFELFPKLSSNEFYVTGESYAGKYVPAVAIKIHQSNPEASRKINLKGIAIGNGWVDPYNMMDYAGYLHGLSFIDDNTKKVFVEIETQIKSFIQKGEMDKAFRLYDDYIGADLTGYPSMVTNVTGLKHYFNFLIGDQSSDQQKKLSVFMNKDKMKKILHVGKRPFRLDNWGMLRNMIVDFMTSSAPQLEVLLDNYRVLLYSGQLDVICPYPLTMNYVNRMTWNGSDEYKSAKRVQWFVGKRLAGYVTSAGNLTTILVRNAGHMVPADQPRYALDMITRFTGRVNYTEDF